jgi:hypothetical protein
VKQIRSYLDGIKKKLYHFTYDKPEWNRKALQLQQSFHEVKTLLGADQKKK